MIININKYPIINAFYGINDKKINVLNIINQQVNKKTLICNELFKNDPCNGRKKKLYITLKNNSKYELNENTYFTIVNNNNIILQDKVDITPDVKSDVKSQVKSQVKSDVKSDVTSRIKSNVTSNLIQLNNRLNNENSKFDYILSTNVRDENNILEFIIYHIMIGFDRILIIDHLSELDIEIRINMLPPFYKNKVEVIKFKKEGSHKLYFLNKIIIPYMKKHCNKYFIHLDGDEYINLNNNYDNIDLLLKDFNYPNILNLNWLLFGSNNKDTNDDDNKCLIPTFTKCEEKLSNHFKILIDINIINKNTRFINPHQIYNNNELIYTNILNKEFSFNNTNKVNNINKVYNLFNDSHPSLNFNKAKAYINHYTVQSKEDFYRRKVNRNRDDIQNNRKVNDDVFNKYNDVLNTTLLKFNDKIKSSLKLDDYSFVILRYVINKETDKMWVNCYNSIRKFYDNKIIIIDDHSKKQYISDLKLDNCFVINSEFKGRGEILPYYYYLKYRFSKRIIVLHDSMKFRNKLEFNIINKHKNFTRIFSFENPCYTIDIKYFGKFCDSIKNGDTVLKYHKENINKLIGCFGVCYVIDYIFLKKIDDKYNIKNLINVIDNRDKRKTLERFFSCLFEMEYDTTKNPHLLGSIFKNLNQQKNKYNKNVFIEKNFYGR